MSSVALGLFVQIVIGIIVLMVNRHDAPEGFWTMNDKNSFGNLTDYEKGIVRGVTDDNPKGVSDEATYQRIYRLRRTSLGVGWGLGLIMTGIFWLGTIYLSDGGLNGN